MKKEIFKTIPNFEDYQVSNFGRVKSFKRKVPRILKPALSSSKYLTVGLNGKTFQIHQLVAIVFLNHKPMGSRIGAIVVDHIDNNKLNNNLNNLQLLTTSQNLKKYY